MSPIASPPPDDLPRAVYLGPGDHFVGDARHEVRTVLGSCVSITLWHPRRRVGAMSHFMLARRGAARSRGEKQLPDGRYGPEALELMLHGLAALGVASNECEAKVFGGGSMFPGTGKEHAPALVGRSNGDLALALLRAKGIPVVSYSLYGVGHRSIVFDIATGDVWAQRDEHDTDNAPLGLEASLPARGRREAVR